MHLDWTTLALQTANVLVLVWLLARFLFRPVTAIIAARQAAADRLLADAAAARAQAIADATAARDRLQGVSADAGRMLEAARAQAEAERTRLLHEAEAAVAEAHAAADVAIGNDRMAMQRNLQLQSGELAIVIARRLLGRLPAKTATAALLESLSAAVAELPDQQRRNLGGTLDIATAVPLDESQQAACRDTLGRLLGQTPELTFRTDPALLAGVELHAPHALIRNSWKADLERIAGALRQDEPNAARSERLV